MRVAAQLHDEDNEGDSNVTAPSSDEDESSSSDSVQLLTNYSTNYTENDQKDVLETPQDLEDDIGGEFSN